MSRLDLRSRETGFTLVELMLAVGLLGILSMSMVSAFTTQKNFYNTNERVVEAQEDARLVLDLIKSDVRMAGFMVAPVAGIASGDNGALDQPDRLCVSDPTIFSPLPDATTPETYISRKVERYLINDTGQVIAVIPPVTVQLSSLDIDGADNGNPNETHFRINSGIILSDGTTSHCAQIQQIAGNTITLNPNHPLPAGLSATNTRAVPAIIYQIPVAAGGGPGTNLMRNNQLMSSTIEDLQVEFWGTDPSGVPVNDLTTSATNPALVSHVRISVVSRSTQNDVGGTKRFGSGNRPAIANRVAGAADTFYRRLFIADVRPRNISTSP